MNTKLALIVFTLCRLAAGQTLASLDARLRAVEVTPQQFAAKRWYTVRSVAPMAFHQPIAMACYGSELYVIDAAGRVANITAVSGPSASGFSTPSPSGMTFLGEYIWVANGAAKTVTRIRLSDGAQLTSPSLSAAITSIENDGTNIWAANGTSKVFKLNSASASVIASPSLGLPVSQLVNDGTGIWALGSAKMLKFNPATGEILFFAQGLRSPAAITFDGVWLWVADGENVVKINPVNGIAAATFPAGMTASAIFSDGQSVYVADALGTVGRFRQNGAPLGSYHVANGPIQFGFDGATVWIADVTGNAVFPKF